MKKVIIAFIAVTILASGALADAAGSSFGCLSTARALGMGNGYLSFGLGAADRTSFIGAFHYGLSQFKQRLFATLSIKHMLCPKKSDALCAKLPCTLSILRSIRVCPYLESSYGIAVFKKIVKYLVFPAYFYHRELTLVYITLGAIQRKPITFL